MPELTKLPKLPDSIAHLRAAVDAHAAATQASRDAGAEVQQAKQQPTKTTEATP